MTEHIEDNECMIGPLMVSFCLTVSHQTDQENAEDGNHMAKIKAKLKHVTYVTP